MRFFTKEGICARLAEKDIPLEPAFEFRKITMLDTVDLDRYRGALAKATQYNQPIQVFDPPKHYFNQPKYLVFSRLDCLLERLTDEDNFLLSEIFGVEHHYWIPQNLNNFDKYYKIFSESEKKPAWDLLRVIAFDTWANYVERQSRYEWLLEGGLSVRINNNEAIDLTNNMYRLPTKVIGTKKIDRASRENIDNYHVVGYFTHTFGYVVADYWKRKNNGNVSEMELIAYRHQINDILFDALVSGELPVYKLPSLQRVNFINIQHSAIDVIFWPEIKLILEERTNAIFPDNSSLLINSVKQETEVGGNDGADSQDENITDWKNDPKLLKLEKQQKAILEVIKIKRFDPMRIPDGEQGTIENICRLDYPLLFDKESSFITAWKKGRKLDLFKMANHASFAKRGKQ